MYFNEDTIAAIASGCTQSGIGVIRISGSSALSILAAIFQPYHKSTKIELMNTYTAHYGNIVDKSGKKIDECIVLYMKNPHSYTGEDVVEIDAHGGIYVCNKILERVLEEGARVAEPGEFTKRAFLNGRMDLTQAEAVMDVISADNEKALNISMNQLNGDLKNQVLEMRKKIIHENAYIEYALDDPEHVSLDGFTSRLEQMVDEVASAIERLIDFSEEGKIMKEGLQTVIVGKPNAGKSSLLNVLLKEERAIVTNIPGTTRDTLQERAIVGGIPLNIIDTAGIRETDDIVEKIGVDKAKDSLDKADLVLYVIDSSVSLSDEDDSIIQMIKNKKVIILLNKSDLNATLNKDTLQDKIEAPMIPVSMTDKSGVEEFISILKEMFFKGEITMDNQVMVTNERQKQAFANALSSLKKVKQSILDGMPEDFFTIDLLDAYEQLGLIIGESVHDDLVNEIFAEFCTGK